MNERDAQIFFDKISGKKYPRSEFSGFDPRKGKPFVAYVYKTDRKMAEYVQFIENNQNLNDEELFKAALSRGLIQVYYYEYPRVEWTGNNYSIFIKDKKIRKAVESLRIKELKKEFEEFNEKISLFENKINNI